MSTSANGVSASASDRVATRTFVAAFILVGLAAPFASFFVALGGYRPRRRCISSARRFISGSRTMVRSLPTSTCSGGGPRILHGFVSVKRQPA